MKLQKIFPFLEWLSQVTKKSLLADIMAGLTGAVIVLPQWIAFATIAWLPPQYGLYTAMVTPIIAALFGSSKHLISWPTTAISLVVFSTISGFVDPATDIQQYISLTLTLTFLAWIYQLAFGLAKLWKVVDFVSHTVVLGFTAGAAILILTSQMKSILWIPLQSHDFLEVWWELISHLSETNYYALWIGTFTFIIALLIKKFLPKWPNLLISLSLWSILAYVLVQVNSHTELLFVKKIPSHLPPVSMPDFSLETIKKLAPWAFAIALLWLIEATSISRAVASKSHQKINANQEFIWQGLSNIVWSFFSSYAWSWSFTRSGVNYSAWAKSPLSAIFAAIFLVFIVLLIAPITKYLPVAAMAWVIMLVWYSLIDFQKIKNLLWKSKSETMILAVTFFSTLFLELEFAIYLWILLSLIIFLNKTSNPNVVTLYSNYSSKKKKRVLSWTCKIKAEKRENLHCPQLEIIRVDMSIYFGSVNYLWDFISNIHTKKGKKHILILASSVNLIDMAWVEMLEEQNEILKEMWWGLYFVEIKTLVYREIKKYRLIETMWEDHFFFSIKWAIEHIFRHKLDSEYCKNSCTKHVFDECWNISLEDFWQDAPTLENSSFSLKTLSKIKDIFKRKNK